MFWKHNFEIWVRDVFHNLLDWLAARAEFEFLFLPHSESAQWDWDLLTVRSLEHRTPTAMFRKPICRYFSICSTVRCPAGGNYQRIGVP